MVAVVAGAAGVGVGATVETALGFAALRALAFLLTTFLLGALLALFDNRLTFFFGISIIAFWGSIYSSHHLEKGRGGLPSAATPPSSTRAMCSPKAPLRQLSLHPSTLDAPIEE